MHCVGFKSEMLTFQDSTNLKHEVATLQPDNRHFLKSAPSTPLSFGGGGGIIFKPMASCYKSSRDTAGI